MTDRATELGIGVSALVAVVGLIGVLGGEGPHLSLSEFDPWLVVWTIGLAGLLGVAPFAIHARVSRSVEDRDRRWELAVVIWGGLALAAGAAFGGIGVATGLNGSDAVGAIALVGLIECGLIVAAVALLMLTTG